MTAYKSRWKAGYIKVDIQLFQERLTYKSVKAYAPMPNGSMVNVSYCCSIEILLDSKARTAWNSSKQW